MESVAFALFLVVTPISGTGSIGADEWTALDGNLSRIDCLTEALDSDRLDAAQKAYGPGFIVGYACEPDGAAGEW